MALVALVALVALASGSIVGSSTGSGEDPSVAVTGLLLRPPRRDPERDLDPVPDSGPDRSASLSGPA